jgi:hypothetical protein
MKLKHICIFCPVQVPAVGLAPGVINAIDLSSPEPIDVVSVSSSLRDLSDFETPVASPLMQVGAEGCKGSSPDLDWLE